MIGQVVKFVRSIDVLQLIADFHAVSLEHFEPDSEKPSILIDTALRPAVQRVEVDEQLVLCGDVQALVDFHVDLRQSAKPVTAAVDPAEKSLL